MNRFGSESPAANALPHTRYMDPRLTAFLDRCVQLDLETGPGGALHKIGAIREGETFVREGRLDASRALAELDAFAAGCDYLLGHNLLGHDLPTLRAHAPVLELLSRPVVDTLYLSPLAFPENPYHRLVKDYKLVRDAVSDPVADARLATKGLSKWGHDFRPDYLYAGRFIKELAARQGVAVPRVACFTATAKRDVTAEILTYFREHLELDLRLFEGGVERDNLTFEVQVARVMEKPTRVHAILDEHLADGGAAVVYASTRQRTQELAAFLCTQGWAVEAFHAGLSAPEKRRIQDAFVGGELRVICATNAFGMGVDKEDVRLVVHLDIPGSLESYVQEAGRAGRDRKPALCVLLYDEQDVERQFRMEAMSELTRQDIAEILRGLRRAKRGKDDSVVLTSGELLRDEELRLGFDADDRQADTRVRVAVAWLERAGLVERNENRTRIFQGRPAVASLEDARRRIAPLRLSAAQEARWLAVLEALINADPDEGFTADELARLPVFKRIEAEHGTWDTGETAGLRVLRTLHDMTAAGLLHQGPQLSAFLRYKVQNGSEQILQHACELERAMLEALRLEAPDAETREWLPLSLPRLNQHLLDQGLDSNPETLRNLLASLARDGRGLAGERGSLELRQNDRDHYRVKLHRDWPALTATATTATPPTARVAAQRPGRCRWLRSACGPGNWACGSV